MNEVKQHTLPDGRFYEYQGHFYPSVTWILSVGMPTSPQLIKWYKEQGWHADFYIAQRGEIGTNVHEGIETLLLHGSLGRQGFRTEEWQMITRFVEFYTEYKPVTVAVEEKLICDDWGGYAGTMDWICMIDGHKWLIDHKTSAGVQDKHRVQLAAYAKGYNNMLEDDRTTPITRVGVLHLRAQTRGPRKGKIQGAGWQLSEVEDWEGEWYDRFTLAKRMFDYEVPEPKVKDIVLPELLTIDI
jgi:hypothetical protein